MINFRSVSNADQSELNEREHLSKKILSFGVSFLDEATGGILPADLVGIGAPSGAGKTQFCCNLAIANINAGKRVHFMALEASENEIERRMKYPMVADLYYRDPLRKTLSMPLNFRNWAMGLLVPEMREYESAASELFIKAYKDIFLFYKNGDFGSDEFVRQVMSIAHETDLIIVDHIHYFDFEDDNENRAIKSIMKTARTLALELQKPIILIGHLRKKDRNNDELVAGLEEFHGSSDFYKIATKIITIAPGSLTLDGKGFETYFRVPKNRIDGTATRFSAKVIFNPRKGTYEKEYNIGYANQSRNSGFEELDINLHPDWARWSRRLSGGSGSTVFPAEPRSETPKSSRGSRTVRNFAPYSDQ